MKSTLFQSLIVIVSLGVFQAGYAADLKVGDPAPLFSAQTHEGKSFNLASRKGHWTVLYFYPKAGTPGCTKQAGAFRDCVDSIRAQDADIFGISTDSVEGQKEFHKNEHLNFTLLADPEGQVVGLYGTKMKLLNMSKRWTFILDPELKVREIQRDVDPITDSNKMAEKLKEFRRKK